MKHLENDLDIYYAVGNANTQRQESEIAAIINKRNSGGWKLISTSTAIVDIKNQFSNLYLFWEKNSVETLHWIELISIRLLILEASHTLISDTKRPDSRELGRFLIDAAWRAITDKCDN